MHHQVIPLIATRSTVRFARTVASHVVTQWGHGHLAEPVTLIVSELVTNTVNTLGLPEGKDLRPWEVQQHHVIHLLLHTEDTALLVGVHDRLSGVPQPQNTVAHTAEHGRGLFLVEAMSDAWGSAPAEDGGKVVWCRLSAASNDLNATTKTQPLPAVSAPLPRRQPRSTGTQAAFASPTVDTAGLRRLLEGLVRL